MTGCLTLLARLGRDNAGNTLVIAAASLLPMMALIGGGVDISRAYMAKTQLQSACDAGVLAGRKAMSKSGSYGNNEKAKATSMFNFNFNGKGLSIADGDVSYTTDDNEAGQVTGTAAAVLPTLLMKIFGMDTVDLSVNCMAELQIGNADIMFVLDNTTSMLYAPEDVNMRGSQYTVNDSRSKFYALKEAVKDFHKTINQAVNDSRTRIRYGFVPYAMTVNAKGLLTSGAMSADDFSSATEYQTRIAKFSTTPTYISEEPEEVDSGTNTYSSKITKSQCNDYGENDYPSSASGDNPVKSGGPAPASTFFTEYNYDTWTKTSGSGSSAKGTCVRRWVKTRVDYETWYKFKNWIYQPELIDTSSYKAFNTVKVATGVTNAMVSTSGDYDPVLLAQMQAGTAPNGVRAQNVMTNNYTWNGCIEERDTVDETDFDPIPDDAFDLNFDAPADDEGTWWHPMWADMDFIRSTNAPKSYYYKESNGYYYSNSGLTSGQTSNLPGSPASYCPAEMKLFTNVQLSDNANDIPSWITTYLGTLGPAMYTYHDIGLIWGGRLTSPTGLFASNVNLDSDKINVSRHIIFMTDGQMQPEASGYSAYGVENLDHRIAPPGEEDTIYDRHMSRFVAMCDAIKAQGTTIWVVAFGTSMTTELQNCASDGRSYYSSNTEALRNTFKFIAAQVADLRLGA